MKVSQLLARDLIGQVVLNGYYGVVTAQDKESIEVQFVEGPFRGSGRKYGDQELDLIPMGQVPGRLKNQVEKILSNLT